MTNKIRQVVIPAYGNPDVLTTVTGEKPVPAENEVLIRVTAIGVNYADILRRKNRYFMPTPLPFVPGNEAVGVVERAGKSAGHVFAEGTRVLAILPGAGGYSSHVCANVMHCLPIPTGIDDKTATGIFVQGSTAQLLISHVAKEIKDKTVLINAAAGGVGSLLVQLAKLNGARVIAACSNYEKLSTAKSLGADELVDYTLKDWGSTVKKATNGKGVDVAFEMVGGDVYNESIRSLAKGGHNIVYGCASGIQGNIHPEFFVDENISQSGFNLAYYIQNKMPVWQQAMASVIQLLVEGLLKIDTPGTFALEDAAEAHRQIEARRTTGKVVLLT